MKKNESAAALSEVLMFERCSKRELKAIARHVETITLPANTGIIEEGATADAFFVLLQGEVAVSRQGTTVATLGPGAHFGELALLDPAPRSASVTTQTEAQFAVLNKRIFRVLLRDMPSLAERLLASLAGQLRAERSCATS